MLYLKTFKKRLKVYKVVNFDRKLVAVKLALSTVLNR